MEICEILFFKDPVLLLVLSAFNVWLVAGITAAMLFIASRFYRSNLATSENKSASLLQQVAALQQQLDYTNGEEMKARAEAARSAKAKEKLLSALSHEIRTPMNGILGMTSLLDETSLNTEQRDYIDTITSSGKILLHKVNELIINDVLEHSKIDTLNAASQKDILDLRNCIEEVLDMFAAKATVNKLDLLYEIDADVPMQVMGDTKRLQQVLINLVENVILSTRQSLIFIGIHVIQDEKNNEPFLVFETGDSRMTDLQEVKNQLTTGDCLEDYSAENEGESELGLAISKKLVEEMKGQIRKTNSTANGENFIFSLPVIATEKTVANPFSHSTADFEGRRILIVDDNLTAGQIVKNQLEQWKLLPEVAESGLLALEILSQKSFSLVITDMDMPGMDGIELSKTIRNKYPDLPILLLNPLNDERYKQHEEIFGEISVVNKPLKQHVLLDNIQGILRHDKKANGTSLHSVKKISEDFSKQYPLRILIGEDNLVNQKWAIKMLNKMGYQPAVADDGHKVLDIVGQEEFDLILMDVQMPGMDGMEATKMIRLCLAKQPVVIAMTANVMHGDRLACMQAGMDDYISKPVELNALVNMLEKWASVIRERKS